MLGVMVLAACGSADTEVAVPIARPSATTLVGDPDTADPSLTPTALNDASSDDRAGVDQERPAGTTPADEPAEPIVPASTTAPDAPMAEIDPVDSGASTSAPATAAPSTTASPTTSPPTTLPAPSLPERTVADDSFSASAAAFDRLARANAAASMTVVRGGDIVFSQASGTTIDGQPANGDTPMVVASVSKIIVAMAIARLDEQGAIDVFAPVPWADLGLEPHPGWADVTVRELLDHRSGLAKARYSWFTGEGTCRDYVPSLLTSPPNGDRGRWVYSNGNYCLLGLLVEQRTGQRLDVALQQLVFDSVGTDGVHLTYQGLLPGDIDHPDGVERLSRLGGAGTLIVSTDDTATALGRMTFGDRVILQPPGVFTDQYGFGHTGTVDGAKACIWVLEDGVTVVSATIAGNSVASGGGVCDIIVPAVASDLGFGSAKPDRTP